MGLLVAQVNLTLDEVRTQLETLDTLGPVQFTRGHAGDDEVRTQLETLDTLGPVRFTRGHAGDDVVVLLPRGHAASTSDSTS